MYGGKTLLKKYEINKIVIPAWQGELLCNREHPGVAGMTDIRLAVVLLANNLEVTTQIPHWNTNNVNQTSEWEDNQQC